MKRRDLLKASTFAVGASLFQNASSTTSQGPSFVFIGVDDLNDWVTPFGGYPGALDIPNFRRLACRGVTFPNAYCMRAHCSDSRFSLWSGQSLLKVPSTFGANPSNYPSHNPKMLPQLLRDQSFGYKTYGAGKSFHFENPPTTQDVGQIGDSPTDFWNEYLRNIDMQPFPADFFGSSTLIDDYQCRPFETPQPRSLPTPGAFYAGIKPACGYSDQRDNRDLPDAIVARYGIRKLIGSPDDQEPIEFIRTKAPIPPGEKFFLSLGFYRPHGPWRVPQRFYDLYPGHLISVPNYQDELDARDSMAPVGCISLRTKQVRRDLSAQSWTDDTRRWLRGYLASISYVDSLIGNVLDAVDARIAANPSKRIITVLYSDHGLYLGQKLGWDKMKLYEHCLRVPLMFWDSADPYASSNSNCSLQARKSDEIVSLVDVYSTIANLANATVPVSSHGRSFSAQVANPNLQDSAVRSAFSVFNFAARFGNADQFDDDCLVINGLQRTSAAHPSGISGESYSVVTGSVPLARTTLTGKFRYNVYYDRDLFAPLSGQQALANFLNEELFDLVADPLERTNLLKNVPVSNQWAEAACVLRARIAAELSAGRVIPDVRRPSQQVCTSPS